MSMLRLLNLGRLSVSRRFCSRVALYDKPESLLDGKVLGNFKIISESEKKTVLGQDAIVAYSPLPYMFGGDIAANVVLAAAARLPALSNQKIMSINVDFVTAGVHKLPRTFHVELLRKSGRFTHILVRVKQSHHDIAVSNVTFHDNEETPQSLSYLPSFPEDCPMPDQLESHRSFIEKLSKRNDVDVDWSDPMGINETVEHGLGFEFRAVQPEIYLRTTKTPVTRSPYWQRIRESEIAKAFSPIQSTCWSPALIAYITDCRFLSTGIRQNPAFRQSKFSTFSHAIWYVPKAEHQMKKPSEWLLHDTSLIMSANNTSLVEGRVWNENKQLLAVTRQQALIRP